MPYKQLKINYIHNPDNTISVKVNEDSNTSFSEYEIYMAYRMLYQLLNDMDFDWSIESKLNTVVERKQKNGWF